MKKCINCQAKPETVQKVCEIVRKQLALPPESELTPDTKFAALGADSLDTVSETNTIFILFFDDKFLDDFGYVI